MSSLTRQQISTLQSIIAKSIPTRKKAKWLVNFANETGIGRVKNNTVEVSLIDIEILRSYFAAQRIPLTFEGCDLSSRTATAETLSNEKLAHNSVTHCRYLALTLYDNLRIGDVTLPAGRATDVTLEELLYLPVSRLIVVENLETFLNIKAYNNITSLTDSNTLFVFRGMKGCYSTKSLSILLEQFDREVVGYFDFDPQGLIQCGHKCIDCVVVPEIKALSRLISDGNILSDYDKYAKQHQCTALFEHEQLQAHYRLVNQHKLALSQEYLSSIDIPLTIKRL